MPSLIGGDFNLVRFQQDKSNGVINHKWSDNFNAWINIWNLIEIKLFSRKFTGSNNHADLIMSAIDRIFCNTELDAMFPLGSCLALPRIGSDNTLILWDLSLDKPVKPNSYKFEKWLLLREAFRDLVEFFSNEPVNCNSSIDT